MTNLHVLLYEPWLPQEVEGPDFIGGPVKPPLATRMPEAVPPGLEWDDVAGGWHSLNPDNAVRFTDKQAGLLFMGQALDEVPTDLSDLSHLLSLWLEELKQSPGDATAALTAALHRLCDERDAAKETSDDE